MIAMEGPVTKCGVSIGLKTGQKLGLLMRSDKSSRRNVLCFSPNRTFIVIRAKDPPPPHSGLLGGLPATLRIRNQFRNEDSSPLVNHGRFNSTGRACAD
jgi:hypothetical protein